MISSFFHLILGICLFILKAIELFYQIASVTSLRIVIILGILVYVLSRYFRLKQPILPQNLVDAICGNQHISNQTTDEQEHQQSNLNQWWPIANRAGCLDSIENSRSAIEKVGIFILKKEKKCSNHDAKHFLKYMLVSIKLGHILNIHSFNSQRIHRLSLFTNPIAKTKTKNLRSKQR